jgi:hypothetical protein
MGPRMELLMGPRMEFPRAGLQETAWVLFEQAGEGQSPVLELQYNRDRHQIYGDRVGELRGEIGTVLERNSPSWQQLGGVKSAFRAVFGARLDVQQANGG